MKKLTTIEEVQKNIEENNLAFIYIGQENCSVCHGLKPQVETIMEKYEGVSLVELDALEVPEVAEVFNVLTVPVMMLFVEGREYLRKARMINTRDFSQEVDKIIRGYQEMLAGESDSQ
ncbi:thioredoxin family protein [Vagococcus fessus]|uniref:Thioredoxin domain-containing protein n=1 Tax=Vagococcus fessus TaxID=120370 RepID=A0A430AB74_9ENTE|nr:thioredoxin family protein [Vagococcus fessus]RSU04477.1 hypothetical protein CBF31_00205 [Vagococcus fessus]